MNVILYQPEIPPNTGNIIRLCANVGARLSLIKPLGFELSDKKLKRAGLDYHEFASIEVFDSLEDCLRALGNPLCYALTTKAKRFYSDVSFSYNDALLFGPETKGLPDEVLSKIDEKFKLRLPMLPCSRSLNLSNTVAVGVYEFWRQLGYDGGR